MDPSLFSVHPIYVSLTLCSSIDLSLCPSVGLFVCLSYISPPSILHPLLTQPPPQGREFIPNKLQIDLALKMLLF